METRGRAELLRSQLIIRNASAGRVMKWLRRDLGSRDLGFRDLGFRVFESMGFRVYGFRVWNLRVVAGQSVTTSPQVVVG